MSDQSQVPQTTGELNHLPDNSNTGLQLITDAAAASEKAAEATDLIGEEKNSHLQEDDDSRLVALKLKKGKEAPKPKDLLTGLRKMLSENRTYGLPGTDGSLKANFYENLRQEHPIGSLLYIHPLHPFSRSNRGYFLWNTLSWLLFVAALFEMSLDDGTDPTLKSFIISLLTVPYNLICKQLLHCWCCVGCGMLEKAGNCFGRSIIFVLSILSLVFLIFGIVLSVEAGGQFAGTFFNSLAFGWIQGIMVQAFMVWWYMNKDQEKFEGEWKDTFEEVPVSISSIALYVRNNTDAELLVSSVEECKSVADWNEYFKLKMQPDEE